MAKNEPPYIPEGVSPPALPAYEKPAIQKPGILAKVMTRMLKLPTKKMPVKAIHKHPKKKKGKFY